MKAVVGSGSLAAAVLFTCMPLHAQDRATGDYPSKPILFHVGYAVGGSADTVGRIVLPELGKRLGQSIILDNRAGAGGVVGLELVARAKPDGYTMGFGTAGTLASNVNLMPNLPYHPLKDLAPVSMVVNNPLVFVVNASSDIKSVAQLLERAKAGKRFSYGSAGPGSSTNLAGELLNQLTGAELIHVPYKGTGPATVDVVAGHLDSAFTDLPTATPHIQAGKLRVLAQTSSTRSSLIPDVPTMAEAGVAGYHFISWFGIVMPAGTPAAIVDRMNKELVAVLNEPEMRRRILAAGGDPFPSSPEKMRQIIETEIASTAKIIKSANISLN
ncbi:tripartite tricarboxylate transporter substrate binding protein [Pigmentiphaga sp. NML080357]|uniref:Bug family tripartite tricarboxylate transporter substrate binding protein n=1 Tax=Pigmentiphaga sp. NML080357 TaxID=2008675 RepID=UPI0013030DEA|nr:tripartite tricarboxylate transporter substrate binding protein [Pigmentiphaga sp. NML080357]